MESVDSSEMHERATDESSVHAEEVIESKTKSGNASSDLFRLPSSAFSSTSCGKSRGLTGLAITPAVIAADTSANMMERGLNVLLNNATRFSFMLCQNKKVL